MSFEPGTQVGRYEIQRRLGGGMGGDVYVAHDPVLGRMVAIKFFKSDDEVPDAVERFRREARSAALLSHPNIVIVYEMGEIDGQPYIVMEYVPGETLLKIIRRKAAVSLLDKLRWISELCAGAGYAHRMSIVHRDIKPANIVIDKTGRLRILDFGIARTLGTTSNTLVAGTAGYMAPEQIRGEEVDHRADVFAIGVVFYELMTYTDAFPGEAPATIMHRVLSQHPKPMAELVADCHPEAVAICGRALAKDPAARYESAVAMGSAIDRLRQQLEADSSATIFPNTLAWRQSSATAAPAPVDPSPSATSSPLRGDEPAPLSDRQTPPPRQRTDREHLARRRAELLTAAVLDGQRELALGNIDAARACCERALAIDEQDGGALALESAIDALRLPADVTVLAGDGGVTYAPAGSRAAAASANDISAAETAYLPSPEIPATPAAEATRVRMPEPRGQARAATPARTQRRSGRLVALGAVAVALIAGTSFVLTRPAAHGIAVIEAAPWAHVAIHTEDGSPVTLPQPAATPLSVSLPAGTYRVTLTGPGPADAKKQLTIEVGAGGLARTSLERFDLPAAEDYFAAYVPEEAAEASAAAGDAP